MLSLLDPETTEIDAFKVHGAHKRVTRWPHDIIELEAGKIYADP
jgi:hypothetical protein